MKQRLSLVGLASLLALMLLTAACSSHESSTEGTRDGMQAPRTPKEQVDMLTQRLNLTPEQSKAIEPILEAQTARQKELMGDPDSKSKPDEATRKKLEPNLSDSPVWHNIKAGISPYFCLQSNPVATS